MQTAYLTPMDKDYFSSTGVNPYYESMDEAMHEAMKKQGQQAVDNIKCLGEMKGIDVDCLA